jgi:hypothetical protein
MKRVVRVCIVSVLLIAVVAATFFTPTARSSDNSKSSSNNPTSSNNQTVYVGVTYCGNSVSDAKLLIDKVKNYTNLFILQSGSLQRDNASIDAIGDYAVNSGLNFIAYMGVSSFALANNWLTGYNGRWGTLFLGIYLDDEPGGKMLDGQLLLYVPSTQSLMTKTSDGSISEYHIDSNNSVTYMRNGTVYLRNMYPPYYSFTYYGNGSITAQRDDGSPITLNDSISLQFTYDQLWNASPIQTPEQVADLFVNQPNRTINLVRSESNSTLKMFTSDYALQWFDYQSGYDVVLTQFVWNESTTQEIAF